MEDLNRGNKGFEELLVATAFRPPVGGIGRQLVGIGNSCIKEEVEEGFLSAAVDPKGGVIRSYLVSSINAFCEGIVHINKLWNRQPLPGCVTEHIASLT